MRRIWGHIRGQIEATRHARHRLACAGAALVLAVIGCGPATAADGERAAGGAAKADEAGVIEARLIDLAVKAGTLKSLQDNAAPVDTGIVAERQTTPVAPGLQDQQQIAQIDAEIRQLAKRYQTLTGLSAGVLAGTVKAARPAPASAGEPTPGLGAIPGHGGAVPRQEQPVPADVGGWSGRTTISPGSVGNRAGEAQPPGAVAAWGWPAAPAAGHAGGAGSFGAAPGGSAWAGDTSGGRVGEIPPPGMPYPGTEGGSHSDALASLDQARRPPGVVERKPAQPVLDAAEAAYEQAYGYLLQQDYGAAQFAFREFLSRHPGSPLASNAQYWVGEIHYVQGQYREAARAFLTGYETHGDGNKGADSLLKLALSLGKLNQGQAACTSLNEFFRRYGSSDGAPVEQAREARQRLKCRS